VISLIIFMTLLFVERLMLVKILVELEDKDGKTTGYDIKTEKVRFEKGMIENIADIDDILLPAYGKDLQELPFVIHVLHLTGQDVIDAGERNIFRTLTEGWNHNGKHVEPVKEVLAKSTGMNRFLQQNVRGGDHSHIRFAHQS
jgi:hypothetical protein